MVEKTKDYLSLIAKLILILSIFNSFYYGLWHIMSANIFLLILLFVPSILQSKSIKFPREFEFLLIGFVTFTFFVSKVSWVFAPIIFGIGMSLVGLLVLLILYYDNQIKKSPFLIITFPLALTVSLATFLELGKFTLKLLLGQELGPGLYQFSMQTLAYVIIGSIIIVPFGYFYIRTRFRPIKKIVDLFKANNADIFSKSSSLEDLFELINEGENEKTEFKSTLRVNLHTNEIDKKIEFSVLKTITSFMNSTGGILLIGVSDSKEIVGIGKDRFENSDKFVLHLINLIRDKVGGHSAKLVKIDVINIEDKVVISVKCAPSNKPVFLRTLDCEEFYIRVGPSSNLLSGSELISYVSNRFKKN